MPPHAKEPADMSKDEWQWLPGASFVQMETGFNCTPIFHGDVIKLFMRSTLNDHNANVSANLRDGETVAIVMPFDKSDVAKRTVIFVTARVIHRAGDEIARVPEAGAPKLGMLR